MSFKAGHEDSGADACEKVALTGSAAVTTAVSISKNGVIELYADAVCKVSIGSSDVSLRPFYVGPGIKYCVSAGAGLHVSAETP